MLIPSLPPSWVPHLSPLPFGFPLTWDLTVAPMGAMWDGRPSLSKQRGQCPSDKGQSGLHVLHRKALRHQTLCTDSSNRCWDCGGQGVGLGSPPGICNKWPKRLELRLFFKVSNSHTLITSQGLIAFSPNGHNNPISQIVKLRPFSKQ